MVENQATHLDAAFFSPLMFDESVHLFHQRRPLEGRTSIITELKPKKYRQFEQILFKNSKKIRSTSARYSCGTSLLCPDAVGDRFSVDCRVTRGPGRMSCPEKVRDELE